MKFVKGIRIYISNEHNFPTEKKKILKFHELCNNKEHVLILVKTKKNSQFGIYFKKCTSKNNEDMNNFIFLFAIDELYFKREVKVRKISNSILDKQNYYLSL